MKTGPSTSTFESFAQATVLRKPDGSLLAGYSHYPYGSVVVCLEHGKRWEEWCEQELGLEPDTVKPERVGDPFERMLEAAKQGCVGFLFFENGVERFILFMGRCDELSNPLPSILCTVPTRAEEGHQYLTSYGPAHFLHDEIVHWQRFDILDPVNAQFGISQPFAHWEPGEPFYELLSEIGEVVWLLESDIFGPWHPVDAVVPLFSSPDCAEDFLRRSRRPPFGLVGLPGSKTSERGLARVGQLSDFTLFRIEDLGARLEFLEEMFPLGAAIFNPVSHRNSTAYTRFFPLGAAYKTNTGWTLKASSGIWSLRSGNQLERIEDRKHWNRKDADTYSWSGGPAYRLAELPCKARPFRPSQLSHSRPFSSDSERDEFLTHWLRCGELNSIHEEASQLNGAPSRFLIQAWDSVTGDRHPNLWFPTALHAIRFLSHYEMTDRSIRINGARGCEPGTFVRASRNPETEYLVGNQFQKSLHRVAVRILSRGYLPKDADDLIYLCNHMLRTLCVNLAGYATDIVKRNLEPSPVLHRRMGIKPRLKEKCLRVIEKLEETSGARAARRRMGPESWALLSAQSQLLLSTAMDTCRLFKGAPCFDFSGVVVQVCKTVEIELGQALQQMLAPMARGSRENVEIEDDYDDNFIRFVWEHKNTLTLGHFCNILKRAHQQKSPLWCAAHTSITQSQGSSLLARPFYGKSLNKLLHSFRNPAAHDKVFNSAQCEECLQLVLGDNRQPGLLVIILTPKMERTPEIAPNPSPQEGRELESRSGVRPEPSP